MARPAKPIELQTRHNTKSDIARRQQAQDLLKGSTADLQPPFPLTETQQEVFDILVETYQKAGVLGELDGYIIAEGAVVIDRLREIEQRINNDPELMFQDSVRNTRKEYAANFFRICNELGLSPQSRAKLGSLAVKKDKADSDPILKIFGGEET